MGPFRWQLCLVGPTYCHDPSHRNMFEGGASSVTAVDSSADALKA